VGDFGWPSGLKSYDEMQWLCVCLFIGLGVLTKTTPFALIPILFIQIYKVRRITKILGVFLVVFPTVLGISILYALGPEHIITKVLSYRSYPCYFGITGILNLLSAKSAIIFYLQAFAPIFLVFLIGISLWLMRLKTLGTRYVVLLTTLLLTIVPALGPGYSPQYIHWYLPIMGVSFTLFDKRWRAYLLVLYIIGILTYLIEYGIFQSLGCYVYRIAMSEEILMLSKKLSTQKSQTLIRLPLFIAYLLIILKGWSMLFLSRYSKK